MFDATTSDGSPVTVRVSFWQAVKVGVGFSIGAIAVPGLAAILQAVTKLPFASMLYLLPRR